MSTTRVEAFSDAVLAIIITMMALELKPPHDASLSAAVHGVGAMFLTYVVTFLYVGIYWNNHHHLMQAARRVTAGALWANLALLFWISLMPFTTAWIDDSHYARIPVLAYGIDLLATGASYVVLQRVLAHGESSDAPIRRALGNDHSGLLGHDTKGKVSLLIYLAGLVVVGIPGMMDEGIAAALAIACFIAVALLWLVPDRRMEAELGQHRSDDGDHDEPDDGAGQ